jgi:hypothetical protein
VKTRVRIRYLLFLSFPFLAFSAFLVLLAFGAKFASESKLGKNKLNPFFLMKGKLKALVMPGQFADEIVSEEVIDLLPPELLTHSGAEPDPSSIMQDHDDILFELLPSLEDMQEEPQVGPSHRYRMTVEDDNDNDNDDDNDNDNDDDNDDDDERVEDEYEAAGTSLRVEHQENMYLL